MKNMEKSKLRIEIFDEWDPELLLFRHKKRNFTHPFLVPRTRKTKNTPGIFCSLHLSFLSILRLLILCLVSNQIEFRKQNPFCDISI